MQREGSPAFGTLKEARVTVTSSPGISDASLAMAPATVWVQALETARKQLANEPCTKVQVKGGVSGRSVHYGPGELTVGWKGRGSSCWKLVAFQALGKGRWFGRLNKPSYGCPKIVNYQGPFACMCLLLLICLS